MRVEVRGFRNLNLGFEAKKINIVVGENGTGKTSLLESIYLSSLFLSKYDDYVLISEVGYTLMSRGDMMSSFLSLSDSEVMLGDHIASFKKVDPSTLIVYLDGEEVARIAINRVPLMEEELNTAFSMLSIDVGERKHKIYTPFYVSDHFDLRQDLEKIFISTKSEGLLDDSGQHKVNYKGLPIYVVGRGVLKKELIKIALAVSDLILIDDLESSMHPDSVREVLDYMKKSRGHIFFSTYSNEVLKAAGKMFGEEAQVVYLSERGYKIYSLSELSEFEKPLAWLGYI